MRCSLISGKKDVNGVLSDAKNDASGVALNIPNAISQTSMKFSKDGVAHKIFVL